jgi:hypothetical protein
MDEDYRIEDVVSCKPASHGDFFVLPQIYIVRKVKDGEIHRLKLPKKTEWKVGEIIRLPYSRVLLSAV